MMAYEDSAVGTGPSGEMKTNEITDLKLAILASAKCDGLPAVAHQEKVSQLGKTARKFSPQVLGSRQEDECSRTYTRHGYT